MILDLPAQLEHIAVEAAVSSLRVLDIICAGNLRGQIAAVIYRGQSVLGAVQDQGWNTNVRENWPHVDEGVLL